MVSVLINTAISSGFHQFYLRSEAICLLPVVLAFYVGDGMPNAHGPAWKSVLLFGGTASDLFTDM